jgi:Tfp pilus assembly protein PilO
VTNVSDRDRKILMAIVPLLVLVAYWFLLFAPKRDAASTAATELTKQEQRRDAAKEMVDQASASKTDFAADYGEIVRMGKAIPAQVDMPSLLVQLDGAAKGTGISFTRITAGPRTAPEVAPAPSAGSTPPSGSDSGSGSEPPVAAGGETAASAPGGATEAANNTAQTSNQQAAAAQQSGVSPSDAQTSTSTSQGGLPVGGGSATGTAATTAAAPPGLETVPLELEFTGNFFHLADFFHRVKRFVHVVNGNVVVNGRLVTIEGINYSSDSELFPKIKAQLTATVYLAPKAEGLAAGATPQGPGATTTPAAAGSTPAPTTTPSPAPTAAVTP